MKSWILPKYVIRSALLAMTGAVVGLWLVQMVFAYLAELDNISETYTLTDALLFILYRSPLFFGAIYPNWHAFGGGHWFGFACQSQ
ncbi:putative membrane protein [Moraxella catarrhalis]|nr:hypothetical protein [Moraxella catarrhalis]OAV24233.1 putative membrane protein [Moraxella catarrhalis]